MPRDQILRDASRRLTEAAEAALHDYSMRLAAEGADTGEIRRKLEAFGDHLARWYENSLQEIALTAATAAAEPASGAIN
jgi:hypothetical protein